DLPGPVPHRRSPAGGPAQRRHRARLVGGTLRFPARAAARRRRGGRRHAAVGRGDRLARRRRRGTGREHAPGPVNPVRVRTAGQQDWVAMADSVPAHDEPPVTGPPGSAARRCAAAARAFVSSLDAAQRSQATAPFEAADRRRFTYLPGPRPGLALADMSGAQRAKAMELLATGLSAHGLANARAVMRLEEVLAAIERSVGRKGWERRHP